MEKVSFLNIAVIFAGGVGRRIYSFDKSERFLEIYSNPIIIHTLEYFEYHPMIDWIVVVCKEDLQLLYFGRL